MRFHVFLAFIFLPFITYAEVFTSQAPDGTVIFTDKAHDNSQVIEIPRTQTYSPAPIVSTTKPKQIPSTSGITDTTNSSQITSYSAILIKTPKQDEVIWSADGDIDVVISTTPELNINEGDTVTILVDSKPVLEGLSTQEVVLRNIERGTHTLEIIVQNKSGQNLLTSAPTTFHIKRPSILLRPNP